MASNLKMDLQEKFLKNLRKKIEQEKDIEICLWTLSFLFMKLKIHYLNEETIDKKFFFNIVKEEMKSDTFQILVHDFDFKEMCFIKYLESEKKIKYIFGHRRNKYHEHGKLKIFASNALYSYATDEAGSTWKKRMSHVNAKWELVEWCEDDN